MTAVVIGHVAAGTLRIRVGSGGIMLPNHCAARDSRAVRHARIAFPRTDRSGIGSCGPVATIAPPAPCGEAWGAMPTPSPATCSSFTPTSAPAQPGQAVTAVPGQGLKVPIYLLGSSDFSAELAAELGSPLSVRVPYFSPRIIPPPRSLFIAAASNPPKPWPRPMP